jgi:hypothetical protein
MQLNARSVLASARTSVLATLVPFSGSRDGTKDDAYASEDLEATSQT